MRATLPTATRRLGSFTRRDFLRAGAFLAGLYGLGKTGAVTLADGLQRLFERKQLLLWLQCQSCSGCSVSFLNTDHPGPLDVLTRMACLVYHPTLSATQGQQAVETIRKVIRHGQYVLIWEGAVPLGMPQACLLAGQPMLELLTDALRGAALVVAAGSCAAFAGIPGAEGNSTGAVCVREFMQKKNIPIERRLLNCPGCPCHPDSLVATLAYVAAKGYPKVDPQLLTPDMIYGHSVHDDCPRFHYWQKNEFAEQFGQAGCLFKLGCLGPLSRTNCPQRQWNGGINWCVRAGAPCIACTSPEFARRRDFAFYRLGEKYHAVTYREQERRGDKS